MTEPLKPVGRKTTTQPAKPAEPAAPKTVKIGGVSFKASQIEADKTTTYIKDGKKMNTVWVKPGVRIDFPNQTNANRNPSIESLGLRAEWYNHDDSYININDLEGATIYGNPNNTDFITLEGYSRGNEIFVDQKESWYINGDMRKDYIELGSLSSDNIVHMDAKDQTQIDYQTVDYTLRNNVYSPDININTLDVRGEGECAQEPQLKASLTQDQYLQHKRNQK